MKKTGWFEAQEKPCHVGFYEAKYPDGRVKRIRFSKNKWASSGFTHWRGRTVILADEKRDELRARLSPAPDSVRSKKVASAAKRLARHYVGIESKGIDVVFFYQIALARGAKLLLADKKALKRAVEKLTSNDRMNVEKKLSGLGISSLKAS
ncbi:hypothetical protein [Paralcaligenes ginsengisoli]